MEKQWKPVPDIAVVWDICDTTVAKQWYIYSKTTVGAFLSKGRRFVLATAQ